MGKGRGGGVTPPRVVDLLRKAVAAKSQSAVAREAGLTLLTVQRYLKGIGEPTTATLSKLSTFFGVSIWWLLGVEEQMPRFRFEDLLYQIKPEKTVPSFRCMLAIASCRGFEGASYDSEAFSHEKFAFLKELLPILERVPDDKLLEFKEYAESLAEIDVHP
ncbi:helix-turn-helix domain-containing protein [Geomonas sp. RF6]|uniref:helix-turn-helix domain-containing protein n=1 Tax=Geomonas sp. RF6 TaxID=2897342 RepID=UPI001E362A94|nr:helix-turn-helix transcriptional regulator [Geomonas sp. RF6]UFS71387.1 helix-turn-helix domain-containing protein [Geomonas sp. RF6]